MLLKVGVRVQAWKEEHGGPMGKKSLVGRNKHFLV